MWPALLYALSRLVPKDSNSLGHMGECPLRLVGRHGYADYYEGELVPVMMSL